MSQVDKDMTKVTNVQENLSDEGQDELNQSIQNLDRKLDPELQQIKKTMQAQIDSGKKVIGKYRDQENVKKQELAEMQAKTGEAGKRTNQDKEELDAFLGGSI